MLPLRATERSAFLDVLRVPYEVAEDPTRDPRYVWIFGDPSGPTLSWPRQIAAGNRGRVGSYRFAGHPIFVELRDGDALPGGTLDWAPAAYVVDAGGRTAARAWRRPDGSVHLPFDPDEAIDRYLREEYEGVGTRGRLSTLRRLAVAGYYAGKPFVPRAVQIAARRRLATLQARRKFPRWPVEDALHDLYDWLMRRLADVAGEPVPSIAPWPQGRSWAMVLTHDVERIEGYRRIEVLREVERRVGLRSSWNFVPERYEPSSRYVLERSTVDALRREGCEVGVHGLRHDGRDLASLEILRERLPAMRSFAERWGAMGFRSPATHRVWEWMPLLGFDYDSSYPDTDPFEPRSGGCCSLLPFFNDGLVELPITLTQDHTLFAILGDHDEQRWVAKTEHIKRRGGMALALTHPDYADDARMVRSYAGLLERYHADPTAWHALPHEVSAWWRRRASSGIERDGPGWRIVGPAAGEGVVAWTPATDDAAWRVAAR